MKSMTTAFFMLAFVQTALSREISRSDAIFIEIEADGSNSSESIEVEPTLGLRFPGDCNSARLRNTATNCGLNVSPGGNHYDVRDPQDHNRVITQIPHTVKTNGTCRAIIRILNARCGLWY
ncbi:hypothetical protein MAR_001980 [Mya arenaria]|uniref:Uncharacterized protein n=1 Tax=Mya arenaria TaxID=6604 RepID=A0ABY7FGJ2_MYAAR|nr:uncharacterized protein LOC128207644 [Mya arenaria]WAR20142.1 hypothetical protein MAR_001980 [Mya arenaria]